MKIFKISIGVISETIVDDIEEFEAEEKEKTYCFTKDYRNIRLPKHKFNKIDTDFNILPSYIRFHCYTTEDKIEEVRLNLKNRVAQEINKMYEKLTETESVFEEYLKH